VLLYRAKGLSREKAEGVADSIMADRRVALDTLSREELGLDPDSLGSPWTAAFSSLLAFAAGAFVVVLPYLIGGGTGALVWAICLFGVALFGVGAGIGIMNGRSVVRSGLRQVIVGGLAAGVTFVIGRIIGTHVS
jgi:VIT1/CCC1 family predicted Fe2+/Mn2+ transporter